MLRALIRLIAGVTLPLGLVLFPQLAAVSAAHIALPLSARAALTGPVGSGGTTPIDANSASSQPNIVMFYIDDAAVHDGRLWNNESLTPNIYDNFIAHGIAFDNSIGESSLCCPARGNLLTGQHTHNNRVTENDGRLFDPTVTIGKSMLAAGYTTLYIGKYLNRDNLFSADQWQDNEASWSELDTIKGVNGDYYGYTLHTKEGETYLAGYHSTQMVGDRAVMRLGESPPDKPIFAILSIFNLHGPDTPLPEFVDDPRCNDTSMPPWDPPNYNEADMSDKPPSLRDMPLQPYTGGWPLVQKCTEMLGVDKVVGMVTAELAREGRLSNTLLVFAGDNGMAWGQHRLGQAKQMPYTTPVPLYMSFPARWGSSPRHIPELVSNIDYAPTFCEIAGPACLLGPYPRGGNTDGKSLLPLLEGTADNLGRLGVLEETYGAAVEWSGVRTTPLFDAQHRWHYVEYLDGFRELYDQTQDPWELNNVASEATNADITGRLHDLLDKLHRDGIGTGDGTITITEDEQPNSGYDMHYTGDLGSFVLDDDSNATYPRRRSFSVAAGVYTIVRNNTPTPTSITCTGVAPNDVGAQRLMIFVHPGETVSCTFVDAGPPPPPPGRPDAAVALSQAGPYKGDNIYQAVPDRAQRAVRTGVQVRRYYWYWVSLENDAAASDSFVVGATVSGPTNFVVRFFADGVDVTSQVQADSYQSQGFETGEVRYLGIRVWVGRGTPLSSTLLVTVRAESTNDPTMVDAVKAKTVH